MNSKKQILANIQSIFDIHAGKLTCYKSVTYLKDMLSMCESLFEVKDWRDCILSAVQKTWEDAITSRDGIGLCYGVFSDIPNYLLKFTFLSRDKFSGNLAYPIPCPFALREADDAYGTYPLYEGEYGELRRDLFEHCKKVMIEITGVSL